MDDLDVAYAAGIVDGEGCIGICSRGRRGQFTIHVTVNNTDARLACWLKATFGGNVRVATRQLGNRKPCWSWRVLARQAEEFIGLVRPYLKLKSEQADEALVYRTLTGYGYGRSATPPYIEARRIEVRERLKVLNQRGVA